MPRSHPTADKIGAEVEVVPTDDGLDLFRRELVDGRARGAVDASAGRLVGEDGVDFTIFGAARDMRSHRFLEFKRAVDCMSQSDHRDWPLTGPRTLVWVLRFISGNYLTPDARHSRFMTEARLTYGDAGAAEHQICCRLLYTLARMTSFSSRSWRAWR